MNITRLFTRHPSSIGETYLEHLGAACRFGMRMMVAGFACTIHALLPFLFERTASDCVLKLHERMLRRRNASRADQSAGHSGTASTSRSRYLE